MKKILLFLFLGLSFIVYPNETLTKDENIVRTNSSISTQSNVEKSTNSHEYEQLYLNQKETNEKLLSLLTTALTLIVGIIIAIIGTSIFYNYRFNKKEYELLTRENQSTINEIHNNLKEETIKTVDKLLDKLSQENDKKFDQINESYKSNYDALRDSLKTIITHFKEDYDNRISESKSRIEELEKENKEISDNLKSDLRFNEKQIRKDLLDIQGELYKLKDWSSLALGSFTDQAILCIETNNQWQLEYVLTDIIEQIEKVISKNDTITPERKRRIEFLLSELPNEYKIEKDKIKDKYKKITIKEIQTSKFPNLVNPFTT